MELAEKLIDIYYENRPMKIWEMDAEMHRRVKGAHDANGEFLYTPNTKYPDKPGKLMGLDISIVDDPGIRMVVSCRKTENSKIIILED
jgi:hypothetical protein